MNSFHMLFTCCSHAHTALYFVLTCKHSYIDH